MDFLLYTFLRYLKGNSIQIYFITFFTSDTTVVTNIHCLNYCENLQSSFSLLGSQNIPFKTEIIAYHFVLGCLGCYSNTVQTMWFKSRHLFITALKSPRSRCRPMLYLGRALFLAYSHLLCSHIAESIIFLPSHNSINSILRASHDLL